MSSHRELEVIDLWDVQTYDQDVVDLLEMHWGSISSYFDNELDPAPLLEDNRPSHLKMIDAQNDPLRLAYHAAIEDIAAVMAPKTIRAFHYSRMTDDEVNTMLEHGIRPASESLLSERVLRQVGNNNISEDHGCTIISRNLMQRDASRDGFFFMSAMPIHPSDSRVRDLVGYWGGEAVFGAFVDVDPEFEILIGLGLGRIFEFKVDLATADKGLGMNSAAALATREFARQRKYDLLEETRDISVDFALPATDIIRVHTEGEPDYECFGRGYPAYWGR